MARPQVRAGACWEQAFFRPEGGGQVTSASTAKWERKCRGCEGLLHPVARPSLRSSLGGVTKLGLTKFEAKIGQGNEPSIRMFQKLHFEQVRMLLVGG